MAVFLGGFPMTDQIAMMPIVWKALGITQEI